MSICKDKAEELWCPFARTIDSIFSNGHSSSASVNRNREGVPDPWCYCITEKCMAWVPTCVGEDGYCSLMERWSK